MTTQIQRLPTIEEMKTITHYIQQSWVFISDDDMFEMTEEHMPNETQEIESIMTSITGQKFKVER